MLLKNKPKFKKIPRKQSRKRIIDVIRNTNIYCNPFYRNFIEKFLDNYFNLYYKYNCRTINPKLNKEQKFFRELIYFELQKRQLESGRKNETKS